MPVGYPPTVHVNRAEQVFHRPVTRRAPLDAPTYRATASPVRVHLVVKTAVAATNCQAVIA